MTVERNGGALTFCCDNCGEVNDTGERDWNAALEEVKGEGWTIRKRGDDWQHFCPDCQE